MQEPPAPNLNAETRITREQLENHTLGETQHEFITGSSQELRLVTQHMADQAKRSVHIVSRHMDPELYNRQEFIQSLSRLARRSKYTQIQVLVQDSTPAVKDGHRLIQLAQQLSSYVKIKKLHDDYKDYLRAFMVIDAEGYVLREFSDRYEATIDFHAPRQAKELLKFFTEAWEISVADPQLRRLYL
ncbi:MAG TPA: hypothetical protein VF268_05060 [Gammaproteobacteria bacterium]|jgi:hypothetical protein